MRRLFTRELKGVIGSEQEDVGQILEREQYLKRDRDSDRERDKQVKEVEMGRQESNRNLEFQEEVRSKKLISNKYFLLPRLTNFTPNRFSSILHSAILINVIVFIITSIPTLYFISYVSFPFPILPFIYRLILWKSCGESILMQHCSILRDPVSS